VLEAGEPRIAAELEGHLLAEARLRAMLAMLYGGRSDERAIAQYQRALEIRRRELGPNHDKTYALLDSLAWTYEKLDKWQDALAMRQECIDFCVRTKGPLHSSTLRERMRFAERCFDAQDADRGRATLAAVERDLGTLKVAGGTCELELVQCLRDLGRAYMSLEESAKAVRWYHEAARAFGADNAQFAKDPQGAADFMWALVYEHANANELADALLWFERYVQVLHAESPRNGKDDWRSNRRTLYSRAPGAGAEVVYSSRVGAWLDCGNLIELSKRTEDLERIAVALSSHHTILRKNWPDDRQALANSLLEFGRCRIKQKRFADAESLLRESLAIFQKETPNSWTTHKTAYELGECLLGQKKYTEAEPQLLAAVKSLKEWLEQRSEGDDRLLGRVTDSLLQLYMALDKPVEAAKWRSERAKYPASDISDKIPAFLKGDFKVTTNADRIALAELCTKKKLYRATAGLYADAFAADPKLTDDLSNNHRYNAACYASLAAAGRGEDAAKLDDKERAGLRKQALAWLRADLVRNAKQLESGERTKRTEVERRLKLWQRDSDLLAIRDAAALAKLQADEQQAFAQLWTDVAELLKKAAEK
jgi:hypothetical protein